MKGLFASLLALMMTGMVAGQQPQNSSFESKQNVVSANGLVGKYLLVLNEEYVQGLKTQGYLNARIDAADRNSIDHIVFHGSDSNAQRTDLNLVGVQPTSATEGSRIVFELSDQMIEAMRNTGLIYILGPQDRGRFDEVVVVYRKSTLPGAGTSNIPAGRNPPPTSPLVGPTLPDNLDVGNPNRRSLTQDGADSFRPRMSPVATRRNSTVVPDFGDSRLPLGGTPVAGNNDTTPAERSSTLSRSPILPPGSQPEQPRYASSPVVLPHQSSPVTAQPVRDAAPTEGFGGVDSRKSELDQLQRQKLESENDQLRRQLVRERQARQDMEVRFEPPPRSPAGSGFQQSGELPSGGLPVRYQQDRADLPVDHSLVQNPVTTQPPERVARLPRQSNKPPAYINQATQSTVKMAEGVSETTMDKELLADSQRIRRQNSALWFIMLCSVGLNFYLSWIARGFYMRYEELADELRETFSTTM